MRKEKGSILMAMIPVFAILIITGLTVYYKANSTLKSTSSTLEEMERELQNEQNYLNNMYNYTDYNYTDYYDDDYDDYDYYNMTQDY